MHPSIRVLKENNRIHNGILTSGETTAILDAVAAVESLLNDVPFPLGVAVALVPIEPGPEGRTTSDQTRLTRLAT